MNVFLNSFQVHLELLSERDHYIFPPFQLSYELFWSPLTYILECGLAGLLLALCQFQVFKTGCPYNHNVCVIIISVFRGGGMLYLSINHINRSQNESLGGGESFSDNSDWCILIAVWWLILEWLLLFLFIQVCYRWVSIALKCSPSMSFSY